MGCDATMAVLGGLLLVALVADAWPTRWAATFGFLRGTLGLSRAVVGFLLRNGLVGIVAAGAILYAVYRWRIDFSAFAGTLLACGA